MNLPYLLPLHQAVIVGDSKQLPRHVLSKALKDMSAMSYFSDHSHLIKMLEDTQWVQKVHVKKQFPGRWWLFYTPRIPVLRWHDNKVLLDREGNPMQIGLPLGWRKLPVVNAQTGQHRQIFMLWTEVNSHSAEWLKRLEQINYSAHSGWELVFTNKIKVKLGDVALKSRLKHFLKIANLWKIENDKHGQAFDFRYKNSFSHKRDL